MRTRITGPRVVPPGHAKHPGKIVEFWIPVSNPAALGVLSFTPTEEHNTIVRSYTLNIYIYQTSTLVGSLPIGKPPVNGVGNVLVDITNWLNTFPAGNYTIKVLTIADGGTSESSGDDFSLPLS